MTDTPGGSFQPGQIDVKSVHSNLTQEIVQITVDKLKLILKDHISAVERKKEWIAPLGLLITLLVVFPTTSFREFIFKAETWLAIFIIASVLIVYWLIRSLIQAFKSPSVDDILEKIKSGE